MNVHPEIYMYKDYFLNVKFVAPAYTSTERKISILQNLKIIK